MTHSTQERNMAAAYAALSTWAARNRIQALKAKKEGKSNWAAIFNAMAMSDEICARRLLMYLRGKVGASEDFMEALTLEKRRWADETFPAMRAAADADADASAREHFDRSGQVAKNQSSLAERASGDGPDAVRAYYVCEVCGYIAADTAPDSCPVCKAVKKKFTPAAS